MKFNHVIWDYDGTLFDSYPAMASVFHEALKERGATEPESSIYSMLTISMGHALKHYSEKYQLDDAFVERYKAQSKAVEAERTKPFDGAVEVCRNICDSGGKNYLFTHRGDSAIYFLEKFGLLPSFAEVITSEQNFARKPSPDAILYLMEKHGFSAEDAMMIGDRDIDILSGKNAGTHTCFFANRDELSDLAEYTIKSISELYGILGMNRGN